MYFRVTLLLCALAAGSSFAQLQPNLPLSDGRFPDSGLEGQSPTLLPGVLGDNNDVNRAGFPGSRGALFPRSSPLQSQRFPNQLGLVGTGAEARTLSNVFENSGDGNFRWEFETTDGTRSEQTGFFKIPDQLNPEGVQAVQGSYSYISPEGIPITVNYIADENGYRAFGDHIPSNNGKVNAGLGLGLNNNGLRLNNRVANNFNFPLGAQGPLPVPTPSTAAAAALAAGGPVLPGTPAAALAAQQAALLRNPGSINVRPGVVGVGAGGPPDLEFLAQQERLRLRNPYSNINNNRINNGFNPYNNNVNGRFQNQNQLQYQQLLNGQRQNPGAFINPFNNRGVNGLAGVGAGPGFGFRN